MEDEGDHGADPDGDQGLYEPATELLQVLHERDRLRLGHDGAVGLSGGSV